MTATGRREGPCLWASLARFRARLGGRASEAQSGVRSRQIAETGNGYNRTGPSRRPTLRLFRGRSWRRRSTRRVREGSRGGLAARVGPAHRGFSKGFFNHSESNYLDAKAGFDVAARPASRFRDDTRIDTHRFDHGASSCPGHHRDRHYDAVATGAPGDTARKAR